MTPSTILIRRSTAAAAAVSNPVLLNGEPGYATDTGVLKIGDGVTPWNDLEPFAPSTSASEALARRLTALETTLALAITPVWTVGAESTVVTHAERIAANLDTWIDGATGYAEIDGTIHGFAPNGSVSSRWTTTPETFLATVEATAVAFTPGGYPDIGYAAGGPIYHDTASGRLIKVYHAERYPTGVPSTSNFWSYLGLAVADEDTPDTWVDLGPVITPERPFVEDADSHAEVGGGPYLVLDGHMVIYYKDTTTTGVWKGLCAARCPLADVLAATAGNPPTFTKLHDGEWGSPGIGGAADDLIPGADPNPWWCDIVHLVDHDRYLMVYTAPEDTGFSLWARTAIDPLSWGLPQRLTDVEAVELIYPALASPSIHPQREVAGDVVRLTYTRSESGWPLDAPGWNPWTDASICQRTLTFTPELAGGPGPPEDWTIVSALDNSWAAAFGDTNPVRYYRHVGRGHLRIPALVGGASGSSLFTLPEGYRPDSFEVQPLLTSDGTTSAPAGQAVINTDGTVELTYFDPSKATILAASISWRIP